MGSKIYSDSTFAVSTSQHTLNFELSAFTYNKLRVLYACAHARYLGACAQVYTRIGVEILYVTIGAHIFSYFLQGLQQNEPKHKSKGQVMWEGLVSVVRDGSAEGGVLGEEGSATSGLCCSLWQTRRSWLELY